MMDFNKIMEGFINAQIDAHKRGDFSGEAGLAFLNGVNIVLEAELESNGNSYEKQRENRNRINND